METSTENQIIVIQGVGYNLNNHNDFKHLYGNGYSHTKQDLLTLLQYSCSSCEENYCIIELTQKHGYDFELFNRVIVYLRTSRLLGFDVSLLCKIYDHLNRLIDNLGSAVEMTETIVNGVSLKLLFGDYQKPHVGSYSQFEYNKDGKSFNTHDTFMFGFAGIGVYYFDEYQGSMSWTYDKDGCPTIVNRFRLQGSPLDIKRDVHHLIMDYFLHEANTTSHVYLAPEHQQNYLVRRYEDQLDPAWKYVFDSLDGLINANRFEWNEIQQMYFRKAT